MSFNWDPSKTYPTITLTNSDRTIESTENITSQATISNWSVSGGKWYWEIYIDNRAASSISLGICNSSFTSSGRVGFDSNSWGFFDYSSSGLRLYHNGSYTIVTDDSYFNFETGYIINFALDMDNHKMWCGINGTWLDSSDPATGTNPAFDDANITGDIYACGSPRNIGDKFTSQFISTEQTYSSPSG